MRRFDPDRSSAVLIGTSRYADDAGLPDLPAVGRNLTALFAVLTDPDAVGMHEEQVEIIREPLHASEVARRVAERARATDDLLLIYYAGHGLLDDRNDFYLGLAGSTQGDVHFDSLPFAWLRRAIRAGHPNTIVVIVDCCFSGRALRHDLMADTATLAADQIAAAGMFTLTATAANRAAEAPIGADHTMFTGELLNVLRNGTPLAGPMLTLDAIFRTLRDRLAERPRAAGSEHVRDFALCPNLAYHPGDSSAILPDDEELAARYRHLVDPALSNEARQTTAERLIQGGVPYSIEAAHYILTDYRLGDDGREAAVDALVGIDGRFAEEAATYWRRQMPATFEIAPAGAVQVALCLAALGAAYAHEAAAILRPLAKGLPDSTAVPPEIQAQATAAMRRLGGVFRKEAAWYSLATSPKRIGRRAASWFADTSADWPIGPDNTSYPRADLPPGHVLATWWHGVDVPPLTAEAERSWLDRRRARGGSAILTMGDYWRKLVRPANLRSAYPLIGFQLFGSAHHVAANLTRLAHEDRRFTVLYLAGSNSIADQKIFGPALRCLADDQSQLAASLLRDMLSEFPHRATELCDAAGLPRPDLP
jgi:hypothetical protein